MKKYLVFTIMAILTAVLLGGTGCSTSKTTTQTPSNTTTSGNSINIVNFTFTPGTLTVKGL